MGITYHDLFSVRVGRYFSSRDYEMNMHVNQFLVLSPEISIGGMGYEPPEEFRCVVWIECERKSDAKLLALRTDEFKDWRKECAWGDNPFAGVTVEEMKCPEGFCCCTGCNRLCPDCKECGDSGVAAIAR